MGLTNNLGKLSNMITSTGSAVGIAQASPSYTLDVTGTGRFAGSSLRLVNSGGSADFILDRANTSSGAAINLNTNGSNKWFFGLRGLADENFYIYNQTAAANNLILNASTGAATLSSTLGVGNVGAQYATFQSSSSTFGSTVGLISLAIVDGTYNPRSTISYKTQTGSAYSVEFDSAYSSGWAATNWIFKSGQVGIGLNSSDITATGSNLTVGQSGTPNIVAIRRNDSSNTGSSRILFQAYNVSAALQNTGIVEAGLDNSSSNGYLGLYAGTGSMNMKILSNGNIGINTTDPQDKLDVNGSIRFRANTPNFTAVADTAVLDYVPTSIFATNPCIRMAAIGTSSVGAEIRFQVGTTTSGPVERMRITNTGYLKVSNSGTYLDAVTTSQHEITNSAASERGLQVNSSSGSCTSGGILFTYSPTTSSGSFYHISCYTGANGYRFRVSDGGTIYAVNTTVQSVSDMRFKENIRDIDTGLNEILALKPRRFDWKEGKGMNIKNAIGFIAQEVEEILPELVGDWKDTEEDETIYKSLGMTNMIPTLVKAIQELNAKVSALENK